MVGWFNIGSAPIPATREEVFASWTDPVEVAAITGKAARGEAAVGQERAVWGGWARSRVVELDPPRRLVEEWRSKDFPGGAGDARLETEIVEAEGGVSLRLVIQAPFPPGGLGYATMMWFQSKMLAAYREHFTERRQPPAKAPPPPTGEAREALVAWLGAARTPAEWTAHLTTLGSASRARGWWRSRLPVQKGLEAWVRGLAPWGPPALVRAAIGAAKSSASVWDEAARARPEGFEDVVSGFAREGGAPPAETLAAAAAWLAEPSTGKRAAAEGTLDPTAQLRFTDRDLGDLFDKRWLYALEAARSAVHAIGGKADVEAALAGVAALEATRAEPKAISDAELAKVCEAIRTEVAALAGG